jgi:hypothetical protein
MRTAAAAAATAASHRARDWREQSHADGRRRHAKYDAQSPRDHCRPRCGRQIQLPQPNGCVFVVVARRDCGSTARQLQALITPSTVHFCLLGVRLNLSQCTIVGPGSRLGHSHQCRGYGVKGYYSGFLCNRTRSA